MPTDESKAGSLGQIQMIAKSLITLCGIYVSVKFLGHFIVLLPTTFEPYRVSALRRLFYTVIWILPVIAIMFLMVFNNNWLVKKILPAEEPLPTRHQKLWLCTSLRIGLIFYGLILLAGSSREIIYVITSIITFPQYGRELISNIFCTCGLLDSIDWLKVIRQGFDFLKIILAIYLIAGAPQFVAWQMKRTFKIPKSEGYKNE
ncbi:MAG: hypothetical protein JW806_09535 [Sedimentisphaerales bacterium]|nr:hypothetical protein [Sedimentisphaerales bacterium]